MTLSKKKKLIEVVNPTQEVNGIYVHHLRNDMKIQKHKLDWLKNNGFTLNGNPLQDVRTSMQLISQLVWPNILIDDKPQLEMDSKRWYRNKIPVNQDSTNKVHRT